MSRPLAWALLLVASPAVAQDALPVQLTDTGHAVLRVVQTQDFTLGEGTFEYDFVAAHPSLRQGTLVVVAVDPEFARPRDAHMPVLYAGTTPVLIVTQDAAAGCVVGLIGPSVDLSVQPVFYGSYEPPERVDAARGTAERAAALAAGLGPRAAAELEAAREPATLHPRDASDLFALAKARVDRCR